MSSGDPPMLGGTRILYRHTHTHTQTHTQTHIHTGCPFYKSFFFFKKETRVKTCPPITDFAFTLLYDSHFLWFIDKNSEQPNSLLTSEFRQLFWNLKAPLHVAIYRLIIRQFTKSSEKSYVWREIWQNFWSWRSAWDLKGFHSIYRLRFICFDKLFRV